MTAAGTVALGVVAKWAEARDIGVHTSFIVELRNYSRHDEVRDLSEVDLSTVLVRLAELSASRARGRDLSGGLLRRLILDLCPDPYADCSAAAQTLLKMEEGSVFDPSDVARRGLVNGPFAVASRPPTSDQRRRLLDEADDIADLYQLAAEYGIAVDESQGLLDLASGRTLAGTDLEAARTKLMTARALVLRSGLITSMSKRSGLVLAASVAWILGIGGFLVWQAVAQAADATAATLIPVQSPAWIAIGSGVMGALGSSLRSLYWIQRKHARLSLRPHHVGPYLVAPFVGAVFGFLVSLLFAAGLFTASGSSEVSIAGTTLQFAFALFSGFRWEWFLARLDGVFASWDNVAKDPDVQSIASDRGALVVQPQDGSPDTPKRLIAAQSNHGEHRSSPEAAPRKDEEGR